MTGPRAEAIYRRGVEGLAFLAALYHLVVVSRIPTFFGFFFPTARHRAVSLSFALVIVYLSYSIRGKRRLGISWFDAFMLVLGMSGLGFVVFFYEQATDYEAYGFLDFKGMVLAYALAISILEALRRLTGWVLPSLIVLFLLAARYQSVLPGLLFGKGYSWDRLGYAVYVPGEGVFGVPLGVASTIVIVFLMFASMLQRAGVGEWFSRLALSLAGWTRGGPAKTAALASGVFGPVSG